MASINDAIKILKARRRAIHNRYSITQPVSYAEFRKIARIDRIIKFLEGVSIEYELMNTKGCTLDI